MKKISIVINTYNRASDLDITLASLYYLEYPNIEVIVVNGPSTDNTEEILEKYKNDIKILRTTERNLSVSRNIGIAAAAGDYVAFIDDDAVPDRKWLNNLIKGFSNQEIAGVGGDVFDVTGVTYQARRILSCRFDQYTDSQYKGNTPIAVPNAFKFIATIGVNSIYRRDVLLGIGGYDEEYDYFLDETDLCARIIDAGYYINYQAGANVYHKFSPSFLRSGKKFLEYTSIVKNIIYYFNQYKEVAGEELVQKELKSRIDEIADSILKRYKKGIFTEAEYNHAFNTYNIGVKKGEESVKRGYKLLMKEETLEKYKADFKKFPSFFNDDFSKKKTIVFLTHEYYPNIQGGIASIIHNIAINLSKRGYNIHIITCDEHKYERPTVTFENNIWVHRVKTKGHDINFLRTEAEYNVDVNEATISKLNMLYTIYEELENIANKHKVDIVHDFFWMSLNFYALVKKKFHCVTTLVTPIFHVFGHKIFNADVQQAIDLERFCVENNTNLMGDSKFIIGYCKSYYNNMQEAKPIYLGIEDKSEEEFKTVLVKDDSKIEILFLGRFEHRKGIDLLLSVVPDICKNYNNVVFRFVGNSPIKDNNKISYKLKKLFNKKSEDFKYSFSDFLDNNQHLIDKKQVVFEGKVEEVMPYYKNCDIFVAPSRFESFGLIYLEAMLFAKPTVGTNCSAIPEVVENGVTGLLMEEESTESLKNCLIKLIEDKDLRQKMGAAGRKRYENLFTCDIFCDNLLKYYEEVEKKAL